MFETFETKEENKKRFVKKIKSVLLAVLSILLFLSPFVALYIGLSLHPPSPVFFVGDTAVLTKDIHMKQDWNELDSGIPVKKGSIVKVQYVTSRMDPVLKEMVIWVWGESLNDQNKGWINTSNLKKINSCSLCN